MRYEPVAFHAWDAEQPGAVVLSPKSHEQVYPPEPPPPVATNDTVSFTAARDVVMRNVTLRGPPGGPRAGCTSSVRVSDVRFPPEAARTTTTTEWPMPTQAYEGRRAA